MKKNNLMYLVVLITILFSCQLKEVDQVITSNRINENGTNPDFLRVSNTLIVDKDNKPVLLRGIAFGNEVWSGKEVPTTHHSEIDYTRVKDMGMNVIRFYLNYKTFENDNEPFKYKQAGWDWLNQNIDWAKKNGIYLILNMHVPQGGFQSMGGGDALWTDTKNQDRLNELWKAIAEKYANEPQIVGFGLVNEPVPTSSKNQWDVIAQRLTNTIRSVNKNHILFIEKPIYVKGQNSENSDFNFPIISDKNTVYEFHTYEPYFYTHQLFDWAKLGDGGKYPDESVFTVEDSEWLTGTFDNKSAPTGDSQWNYLEGVKYKVDNPKITVGVPALIGANVGGKVFFDNLVIKEYNPNGVFTKDILIANLNSDLDWGFWSSNNSGKSGLSNSVGYDDSKSLFIESATGDCNMSNYKKAFLPKQGYYYQISGWVKGEKIASNAACKLRIDFLTTKNPVLSRNKQYMEASINKYLNWGKAKNVPIYMGEFGAGIHCFKGDKGGLTFVSDVIDINRAGSINFTYHTYHEDSFGLYFGYGSLPDPSKTNQPLIELFKQKLK